MHNCTIYLIFLFELYFYNKYFFAILRSIHLSPYFAQGKYDCKIYHNAGYKKVTIEI